jgi:PAS domain S-box-containing protein
LEEREAHFRLLTENVSDVIWKLDSNYHVTYISPADERLRGYKVDEIVGHHVFDLMTEQGVAIISEKMRQRIEAEKSGIQIDQLSFEVQQRCKDGNLVWTEILSTAERDANGKIIGFHGVSRNINERKRREEAAKMSERFLQSTLDRMFPFNKIEILPILSFIINILSAICQLFLSGYNYPLARQCVR